MFFSREWDSGRQQHIKTYLSSSPFQRLLICIITVIMAFVIIETGAAPKKYKLNLGNKSSYDITAPRDIENKKKTAENAQMAADSVIPVMKEINTASIEVFKSADDFITFVESARKTVDKNLQEKSINKKDPNSKQLVESEQEQAVKKLGEDIKKISIPLSMEQLRYLVAKAGDETITNFRKVTMELITNAMQKDITHENLAVNIDGIQSNFQEKDLDQEFKNIGILLVKAILKPNRTVDEEQTKKSREEAKNRPENIVKILKDERIISYGDIVTEDKFEILKELNLLETTSRFDFGFAAGILVILILMASVLVVYMNHFCKDILERKNDIIILSIIILLTLAVARGVHEYSPMAIPIFIAVTSISILLDVKLAIIVNFILTIAISLITKGAVDFIYMSLISGTLAAFLVEKINQRSKLSMAGMIIGIINVLIIVCIGIINKSGLSEIGRESLIVFLNGVVCIILTIGMLPFWESTFNVITPLKLLELTNPNQPLIKRLLMEAPGTYHHSLMVGNLAEVATEAIGGNALMARVGAYYHDVGKLRRPNFFKENQMSENPHDKMTANLSTLVITAHTHDGDELAKKNKIPLAIRDIIVQHHGTTLVAFFYHKAKKGDKAETVKPESFRYDGPRPSTKEAAVVMLADSVEAAVRSMIDKTEGKIEGLVRKIIKDKLDDGQLDSCSLTLKDLDDIAQAFMRVYSGYFHERAEYPEIKARSQDMTDLKFIEPSEMEPEQVNQEV